MIRMGRNAVIAKSKIPFVFVITLTHFDCMSSKSSILPKCLNNLKSSKCDGSFSKAPNLVFRQICAFGTLPRLPLSTFFILSYCRLLNQSFLKMCAFFFKIKSLCDYGRVICDRERERHKAFPATRLILWVWPQIYPKDNILSLFMRSLLGLDAFQEFQE